jgi:hypothetical protein
MASITSYIFMINRIFYIYGVLIEYRSNSSSESYFGVGSIVPEH